MQTQKTLKKVNSSVPDNKSYNRQIAPLRKKYFAAGKPYNLNEMLCRSAAIYAGRTQVVEFVRDEQVAYSADRLYRDAACLAAGLCAKGLQGKNIAVFGQNSYAWLVAFFGIACGVGTVVPLDKEMQGEKLATLLKKADAELVLCDERFYRTVSSVIGAQRCVLLNGAKEDVQTLQMLVEDGKKQFASESEIAFMRTPDADDTAAIVFTSGTTGANKGVMLSHRNLVENAFCLSRLLPPMASALSVLPMNHVFELGCTVLTAVTINGVLYINDSLRHFMKNALASMPQMIVVVPSFIDFLYKEIDMQLKKSGIKDGAQALAKMPLPVRYFVRRKIAAKFGGKLPYLACGGAPVRTDYLQAMQAAGFEIFIGYGLSESSPIAALNLKTRKKPEAVGVPVSKDSAFRITNPDEDGIGEIQLTGANVSKGYYNDPQATAACFADGWFSTGDYGRIDKDGELFITGRKKNLIVLDNGKNISPEEIEQYLLQNVSGLREAVVFESIKQFGGTQTKVIAAAVYVKTEDFPTMSEQQIAEKIQKEIIAACLRLPAFMRVGDVEVFTKEFEKTTTLKIVRQTVVELYNQRKGEVIHV